MILFPTDRFLSAVRVADVLSYQRSTGWIERLSHRPGAVFAQPAAADGEAIVEVVPVSERSRDYPLRMEELLRSLSQLEDRPPADILWDIITPDCDRVIFRLEGVGSVGLDMGLQLLRDARELIRLAAKGPVSTQRWRVRNWPEGRFTFAIELPLTIPTGNGASVAPERELTHFLADELAGLEQPSGDEDNPGRAPSSQSAEILGRLLEAAEDGSGLEIRIVYGRSGSQAGPTAREFVFSRATRVRLLQMLAAS